MPDLLTHHLGHLGVELVRVLIDQQIGTLYQIGLPFHFGWQGFATGDVANVLTSVVGEPNTGIHEGKALTCALRKGRLHRQQEGP